MGLGLGLRVGVRAGVGVSVACRASSSSTPSAPMRWKKSARSTRSKVARSEATWSATPHLSWQGEGEGEGEGEGDVW